MTSASDQDPDSALTMMYDGAGRLQSVDNVGTPGAPHVVMTYGYDANGNVTSVQDFLGGTTSDGYDGLIDSKRVSKHIGSASAPIEDGSIPQQA